MARPKANTPKGIKATRKWKETMLKQYKNEEEISDFFRRIGSKGGRVKSDKPRGFAANRELASIAGCKGGRISRRDVARKYVKWEDVRAEAIAMYDSGECLVDIAKKTGVPYGSLRYYLKKETMNE